MNPATGPMTMPLPQRTPPPMFSRRHKPPVGYADLARTAERLQHMDDHQAVTPSGVFPYPGEPSYPTVGALMDAMAGATPATPVAVHVTVPPSPVTSVPEGVARGLLMGALWDAHRWYDGMDPESCAECAADGGLCGWHAPRAVKAREYAELGDYVTTSPADADALSTVAAAVLDGHATPGDIARPGSPLEALLAAAIAQAAAERSGR